MNWHNFSVLHVFVCVYISIMYNNWIFLDSHLVCLLLVWYSPFRERAIQHLQFVYCVGGLQFDLWWLNLKDDSKWWCSDALIVFDISATLSVDPLHVWMCETVCHSVSSQKSPIVCYFCFHNRCVLFVTFTKFIHKVSHANVSPQFFCKHLNYRSFLFNFCFERRKFLTCFCYISFELYVSIYQCVRHTLIRSNVTHNLDLVVFDSSMIFCVVFIDFQFHKYFFLFAFSK